MIHQQGWGLETPSGGGSAKAAVQTESEDAAQRIQVDNDTLREEMVELLRQHSPPGDRDLTLRCNCATEHKQDKAGCGSWFSLHVSWKPDDEGMLHVALSPGPPVTGYEEKLAEQRDQMAETKLDRLRASAGSWRTGLLALVALIPTLVVVKGTDTLDTLSNHDKSIVGILTLVGAVLIVVAALCALRAAYGPLGLTEASSDDLTVARENEVRKSSLLLRATWILIALGGAALIATIAWAWQAPSSVPAKFAVTRTNESIECGTLVGTTATQIRVKKSDGSVVTIPFADVKTTSFATKC